MVNFSAKLRKEEAPAIIVAVSSSCHRHRCLFHVGGLATIIYCAKCSHPFPIAAPGSCYVRRGVKDKIQWFVWTGLEEK